MAKKKKPWYRARNVILAVLAVALAWLGWGVYVAVTAKPGVVVDYGQKIYDLAAAHQPGGPEDPNAWDPLQEACAILDAVWDETARALLGATEASPPEGWDRGYRFPFDFVSVYTPGASAAVVEQTLVAMDTLRGRGLDEKLAAIAATPRALRPRPEGRLQMVLLPELGTSRRLAQYSAARMYLAHMAGDCDEQITAFEQALAVGRVLCSQWTLIDRLVGQAVITLALTELRSEMSEAPLSAEACRRALDAIDRQLGNLPPLEMAFNCERALVLDSIQWTYSDDGRGNGRLLLTKYAELKNSGEPVTSGLMSHPIVNVAGYFYPSKASVVAKANEHFDQLIEYAGLSRDMRAKRDHPYAAVEKLPKGYMVLKLILPALGKAVHTDDATRMQIGGTRLNLALQLYRHEHGRFPDTLDQLVPGILPELPIDAMSGKPYGYRPLSPDEDPHGWGYVLYSFGADGQDDGGTLSKRSNMDALHRDGKGSDYLFTVPRSAN